jgi:hypothetical protein
MCMPCFLASSDSVTCLIFFCQYLTIPESSNQSIWLFFSFGNCFCHSLDSCLLPKLVFWGLQFVLILRAQSQRPFVLGFTLVLLCFITFHAKKTIPPSVLFSISPLHCEMLLQNEKKERWEWKKQVPTQSLLGSGAFKIQVHDPLTHSFLPNLSFLSSNTVHKPPSPSRGNYPSNTS